MNHQPTQLALLISLIGIGAAPHANASASISARPDALAIDTLALGAIQPLPGVVCDELEAGVLPACGANTELAWLPPRNPLDRTATAGVRVLYSTAPHDDWAPGELGGESARVGHWVPRERIAPIAKAATTARELPRQGSRKSAGKIAARQAEQKGEKRADKPTRKVRVLAQVPASAHAKMPTLAQREAAIERIERLAPAPQAVEARPTPAIGTTARQVEQPVAAAASVEVAGVPSTAETSSTRVLRQLGAILSEERDEVGAIRPPEPEAALTTQADKVMRALNDIVTAQPPAEDGPARRLRKLAERAAKAEAKAAADAAATLAAEIARDGVDLMLPLEPPTAAAAVVAAPAAVAAVASTPPARPARANPFGSRPVALADTSLDRVRGGFSVDGLSISFGIERAVYVNGALVTTTSLNLSDLGRITAGRGTTVLDAGTIGLIQSGAGNVVSPTMISAGSVGTVIQNTLDGQKIQNVTIINATTNSLGLLKGINMQSSLRGAVIDSLRR